MQHFFTTMALTAGIPFLTVPQEKITYEEPIPAVVQEESSTQYGETAYEDPILAQKEGVTEYEEPIKTPEEIQRDLEQDEILFKQALEMFNPWYAGPLLTGGAHMMPPGVGVIQPYVFVTDTYALWDSERKTVHIHDNWSVNPSISPILVGLTDWLDMAFSIQGFYNWQRDSHDKVRDGGGYGDCTLGVGFPLMKEDLKKPAIKFVFNETFPTGKYQRLNPSKIGLDATGAGSFQSQFGLRISKLYFWSRKHPVNLRAAYSYTIPSRVHVREFNSYGGSDGTAGTVNPGNYQQANAAFEYSFTQKWVFALDAVYTWKNKTKFHGTPGFTSTGALATVGGGSNDQLSFAPAIEYNPTPILNFLAGVWFDVYGRNTGQFVSGIVSVAYTFSVGQGKY